MSDSEMWNADRRIFVVEGNCSLSTSTKLIIIPFIEDHFPRFIFKAAHFWMVATMTRFPGHAPLDLQAGSKMVACSSRWASRAIHFKRGEQDGGALLPGRSDSLQAGLSRRPGRALLQAGMRDGRLYFPTPRTGLPLFEFWFKFPFHHFHHSNVQTHSLARQNFVVLYLWNGDPQIRGAVGPDDRLHPVHFKERTIGHPRAGHWDGRLPVTLTTNMDDDAGGRMACGIGGRSPRQADICIAITIFGCGRFVPN
ncbi:hypothetical protein B0H14DRAFT_2628101 [Mycena olivaceomarginata]|nr:hypothetical protein B0H14DRAFT_2628101 [Mycena olivaceomarginata]